jgi:hypothetical protein
VAHPSATEEGPPEFINETARKQGSDYTITPDRVRTRKKTKKPARKAAPSPAARTNSAPPRKAPAGGGISLGDVRAVKGLVDKIGADRVQELAGVLGK